jgi:hypothetical protein
MDIALQAGDEKQRALLAGLFQGFELLRDVRGLRHRLLIDLDDDLARLDALVCRIRARVDVCHDDARLHAVADRIFLAQLVIEAREL